MPQIADYVPLLDGRFTLPNNDDGVNRDFSFTLPNDTAASAGVLSYVVKANSPGLTYTIKVNGVEEVNDATQIDAERRAIQEVVSGANLKKGANTLEVERTGGSGSVQFSDIVLWFQRNI